MGEYVNGFLLNISQNKTLGENYQEMLKILQKKDAKAKQCATRKAQITIPLYQYLFLRCGSAGTAPGFSGKAKIPPQIAKT